MKKELFEWVKKLWDEKPDDKKGRPVPPEIYAEALHWMTWTNPKIELYTSKEVMDRIGRCNTLFCGHFIYPEPNATEW